MISRFFYKQRQTEIGKKVKQMLSNEHTEAELLLFENYAGYSYTSSHKIIDHILKNKQKNKCVCIHQIIQLIIMKMKVKMKNRSHRYDNKRPWSRDGHKDVSKCKKCLILMMLMCVK